MRLGNISPIISQGIGPNPIEKLTTYTTKAIRGIQPGVVPGAISFTNKEIVFCFEYCLVCEIFFCKSFSQLLEQFISKIVLTFHGLNKLF